MRRVLLLVAALVLVYPALMLVVLATSVSRLPDVAAITAPTLSTSPSWVRYDDLGPISRAALLAPYHSAVLTSEPSLLGRLTSGAFWAHRCIINESLDHLHVDGDIADELAATMLEESRTNEYFLDRNTLGLFLDIQLTRRQQFEALANWGDFGARLPGYRAASEELFSKTPSELSPAEAATLVAFRLAPGRDRTPKGTRARRDYVLRRMAESGVLPAEEYERALSDNQGSPRGQ